MSTPVMVSRENVGDGLAPLNLNDPSGRWFLEDDGDWLLLGQEFDVTTETREWLHHEVDTARRKKSMPWRHRVHFPGPDKATALANAAEVIAAMSQPYTFTVSISDTGAPWSYEVRARGWVPVLDDQRRWWKKGRLTIDFNVVARALPGHPLA